MVFDLNLSASCDDDGGGKAYNSAKINKDSPQIEDVEGSVSDDQIRSDIEKRLEPGSLVEDIHQAYVLYCEYARCKGFSVRKGCQKYFPNSAEIRMKVFNCSCEGQPDNKRSNGRIAVYKKQVTRSNCKARLRVMREQDGLWIISVFEKVHNHELVNPDESYLLRSARQLCGAKKSILEAMHAAGIPVTRACKFMERESGGRQNLGFTRTDAYMHLARNKAHMKVDNGDANALLKFLEDKANKEPFFFHRVDRDIEGKLVNFFFRDSRCAIDYEYFGDVISFDTTYKTNKYNMICAPFIGVNHHFHNVMFGLAFLSDESTATFEWLFRVFLEAMYGKEPEVIFSDQCLALMNGVDYTFKTAAHRLCQWHISQNAPPHFGELNGNREFKNLWNRCMNGCESEEEFEEVWQKIIKTHDLANHKWFRKMYNLRTRWSSVFTNDRFSAGLHATSRSEVTNRILKDLGTRSNTLYEFVARFCEVQNEWRLRERAEDALCIGMPGQFVKDNPLLTDIAKVFTRNIYKLFEYEAHFAMNTKILEHPDYGDIDLLFEVVSIYSSERPRRVSFNKDTLEVSCSCRMWESKGVFCRHIFKVLNLMNVEAMPERYILRRWTRECKRRVIPELNSYSRVPRDGGLSSLVFVNNIMRATYDLAYELKGDPVSRNVMQKSVFQMRDRLLKDIGKEKDEAVNNSNKKNLVRELKNPSVVKSRGKQVRRKWRKKKMKGPKGEGCKWQDLSPVMDSSVEFEYSMNTPDDYWPEFCREFSTQQSRFETNSMDVDHIADNKIPQELRGDGFDRTMPYKWL